MKILTIITFLLMPAVSFAQTNQSMNGDGAQKMMQQIAKMQSCIQNVNQSKLMLVEQRIEENEAKVSSLCASGQREEAQVLATSFMTKIKKNPTMKIMLKCGELMEGVMHDKEHDASQHACDDSVAHHEEDIH